MYKCLETIVLVIAILTPVIPVLTMNPNVEMNHRVITATAHLKPLHVVLVHVTKTSTNVRTAKMGALAKMDYRDAEVQ